MRSLEIPETGYRQGTNRNLLFKYRNYTKPSLWHTFCHSVSFMRNLEDTFPLHMSAFDTVPLSYTTTRADQHYYLVPPYSEKVRQPSLPSSQARTKILNLSHREIRRRKPHAFQHSVTADGESIGILMSPLIDESAQSRRKTAKPSAFDNNRKDIGTKLSPWCHGYCKRLHNRSLCHRPLLKGTGR
jgi:phytoene dehydrogenase-like protein